MSGPRRPRDALEVGLRALRPRDHSVVSLGARLDRRGIGADERNTALERLRELGYLDDDRFARTRASALAERGAGDRLIAADLERHGIPTELVTEAIGTLEPEHDRAQEVVARRGLSPRTARLLAARGFGAEVVESIVAAIVGDGLG